MAAPTITRNANTVHVTGGTSATDVITAKPVILVGVVLTATTNSTVAIADTGSGNPAKLSVYTAGGSTGHWDLSGTPILFPNGIRATLTNTTDVLTLIVVEGRK
jgi:hypothetical protein